jgi:hypothetical protein
VLLVAVVAAMALAGAPSASARATTLTARAGRGQIRFGGSTTIAGRLSGNPAGNSGRAVELRSDPYPYGSFTQGASTTTAPDGSYSFGVSPGRNTRYRVVFAGPPPVESPTVRLTVDERLRTHVSYPPLGRARITVVSHHPADLTWGGKRVSWYLSLSSRRPLRRVKLTKTREVRPGVTRLRATLPVRAAGRFQFAACFRAHSQGALGRPGTHPRCGRHRFRGRRRAEYRGRGNAPFGYPGRGSIGAATRYLAHRAGVTSFAVVGSEGRMYGAHVHRRFVSASVVKAMLLVAYLRMLHDEHRGLDSHSRSNLYPMIHVSDNSAATRVWSMVGDHRLRRLAHAAGMADFSIHGIWANAMISAADQARFFFEMNRLIPRHFRGYANGLLSHIVGYESWGVPAVARPRGWKVYFKGGWRPTNRGQLVHQVGRLERRRERIAIAVMTDGDPSMAYGIRTIQGVTGKLLRRRP